jgi:hypothetical protein
MTLRVGLVIVGVSSVEYPRRVGRDVTSRIFPGFRFSRWA